MLVIGNYIPNVFSLLKNRYLMIICSMNSRKDVTEGGTEQDNNNTSIHKFSIESAGIKKCMRFPTICKRR